MVDIEIDGLKLNNIIDDYERYLRDEKDKSLYTVSRYKRILKNYCMVKIAEGKPWDFTVESVNEYLRQKNIGMKEGYVYKYAIKEFYNMKGREDLAKCMIKMRPKPRQKNFKFLSHEKVRTMINEIPNALHRTVAIVQYLTGARCREAWCMKAEDIDFDKDKFLIYIRVSEFAKKSGGQFRSRYLRMNKFTKEEREMVKQRLILEPTSQLPIGTYEKIFKSYVKHQWGFIFLPVERIQWLAFRGSYLIDCRRKSN